MTIATQVQIERKVQETNTPQNLGLAGALAPWNELLVPFLELRLKMAYNILKIDSKHVKK